MAKFVFRLQAVLGFRQHRRDLCRTVLARFLDEDRRLVERIEQFEATRIDLLSEIRDLTVVASVDVDRAAARRFYASQLVIEVRQVNVQRQVSAERIELCRRALCEADREVKVIEKLKDKQREEFDAAQLRRAASELEDTWFSAHAMEFTS